ncbi:2OG-Fe(II) oxygenase [Sphingomonas pokkalii]|nr:2OG-Fe(II) oxygenase [Sphingomonas pokkalii]
MQKRGIVQRSLLNPVVLERADSIRESFLSASPFRHVVIDDFLMTPVADQMLAEFPAVSDTSKLVNEFGVHNAKSAVSDVRGIGGIYLDVDTYIQGEEFISLMQRITGIDDLQYDPWYYGAGTHENFHGAGLEAHYDFNIHPHTAYHRRLNAIIYLNKDWQPEWAGDISFHTDPWDLKNDQKKTVIPEFNRCVIFETTESSWHSVGRVSLPPEERHRSRKSFTIYLYTKSRPAEETAPEHGTVYVPPPLPSHIRAGHVLTEADMEEVNRNLEQRHDYLKQMYKREYRFSSVIEDLKRQIGDWKRASRLPLAGAATILSVREPIYPDGWMGERTSFQLRIDRPAATLVFRFWQLDAIDYSTAITGTVNGVRATVAAGPAFTEMEIPGPFAPGEMLDVVLEVDRTRRGSESDMRQISVQLSAVEFR